MKTAHAWVGGGWPFRRHIRPPGSQDSLSDTHTLHIQCTHTQLVCITLTHCPAACPPTLPSGPPLHLALSSKERLSSPVIPVKGGTSHQCKKGSQLLTAGDEQREPAGWTGAP